MFNIVGNLKFRKIKGIGLSFIIKVLYFNLQKLIDLIWKKKTQHTWKPQPVSPFFIYNIIKINK